MKYATFFSVTLSSALLCQTVTGFITPSPITNIQQRWQLASALDESTGGNDFYTYQQVPGQRLAMQDVVVGDGATAENGVVLTVKYEGRLMATGKKFDSGTGFSFRLGEGRVIPGWEQGLVGMKVGGKRILRIPPELAYADRGAKDVIPPGSHLEFDCELISIASGPVEEVLAQVNVQKERIITFVLLLILLAVSPSFG